MKVTLLGTGTSTGIPVIGCECKVCTSADPKNKRSRASCFIETEGKNFLIDTSTDFREQVLKNNIKRIDAVLFTHAHADHIHGIDDLRCFNYLQKEEIPVYIDDVSYDKMNKYFDYIFCNCDESLGFIPRLIRKPLAAVMEIKGIQVNAFPMQHGKGITYGYRMNNIAYCTDVKSIPETSQAYLENLDLLILDSLRFKPHPTHMNMEESLALVQKVKPKHTVFIHMTHDIDHDVVNRELPAGVELGYDGMKLDI